MVIVTEATTVDFVIALISLGIAYVALIAMSTPPPTSSATSTHEQEHVDGDVAVASSSGLDGSVRVKASLRTAPGLNQGKV